MEYGGESQQRSMGPNRVAMSVSSRPRFAGCVAVMECGPPDTDIGVIEPLPVPVQCKRATSMPAGRRRKSEMHFHCVCDEARGKWHATCNDLEENPPRFPHH